MSETKTPRPEKHVSEHVDCPGTFISISDEYVDVIEAELAAVTKELEIERMRLVACGVVAMMNTRSSAKEARIMHEDYESASCNDVAHAVDREMQHREDLARVTKERDTANAELAEAHTALRVAGDRFAKGDKEGVRQLLCDMNARTNARNLYDELTAELARLNESQKPIDFGVFKPPFRFVDGERYIRDSNNRTVLSINYAEECGNAIAQAMNRACGVEENKL